MNISQPKFLASQVALVVKESTCRYRKQRRKSLGQEDLLEKGMATHSSSCLEKPMDRGAWQATVHGVAESDMTEATQQACTKPEANVENNREEDQTNLYIYYSAIKKKKLWKILRNQSSVAQLCLTLCDPMDFSMSAFPVLHQFPELTQTHVY